MTKKIKGLPSLTSLLGGSKEPDKPKPKVKHKKTLIESHKDGSHTIRHSPDTPEEVSYAASNLDKVIDGLKENLGEPKEDEGEQKK